jgi:hypothetical protein
MTGPRLTPAFTLGRGRGPGSENVRRRLCRAGKLGRKQRDREGKLGLHHLHHFFEATTAMISSRVLEILILVVPASLGLLSRQ